MCIQFWLQSEFKLIAEFIFLREYREKCFDRMSTDINHLFWSIFFLQTVHN